MPKHIAFIMDGNGRWAKKRLLPRKAGHREGVKTLKKMIDACNEKGIEIVSLYAFSTENWARPKDEVDALLKMILSFAKNELKEYAERNFVIRVMGSKIGLGEEVRLALEEMEAKTKDNSGLIVNLGINYGGRDEIVNAVNNIIASKAFGDDNPVSIEDFNKCLYTGGMADPDIIVRTSGEQRLSNFMLWQSAYSEFIFINELWPDLDKGSLDKILEIYSKRNRKFGKVK